MRLNVTFELEYANVTVAIDVENDVTDDRAARVASEIFEEHYDVNLWDECRNYEVEEGV